MPNKKSLDTSSVLAVAYWRMSSSPQEKSIPQQKAEMLPRATLEKVHIIKEFQDDAISGGGMTRRDAFKEMVAFCEKENRSRRTRGEPIIETVVCFDTSRFSRADSNETAAYIWTLRTAGVNRVLTWERWWDFRREEDRAIFNIQQDFTNNRYLRDLSLRVLRGRKDVALAGYFAGGQVPYGFDRVMVGPDGVAGQRFPRGEKILVRQKGYRMALAPIPEDETEPARQLERQSAIWLFETFDSQNYSYRTLARMLNERSVPGPGATYKRKTRKSTQEKWTVRGVKGILTNPVYRGQARVGRTGKGRYHRLVGGEIQAVEPTAPRQDNQEDAVLRPMEYGGLVSAELFERVQAKTKERYVLKSSPRCNGYVLPPGILHCGHCGGRMHGSTTRHRREERVLEYRRYACSTTKTKPAACRDYSAAESDVVRVLVTKLLDDLREEGLSEIERKLTEKVETRQNKTPGEADRLRGRLEELESEIRRGAQNLLRATANQDILNELLTDLRNQKSKAEQDLAAMTRRLEEPLDAERGRVLEGLEALRRDRAKLEGYVIDDSVKLSAEDAAALGELIRRRVVRIDLYFDSRSLGQGRRTAYSLKKSIIKMRPLFD